MKKTLLLALMLPLLAAAQVKIPKGANRFTYWQIEYGEQNDTSEITVYRYGNTLYIHTPQPEGELIRGYCQTVTGVDYDADSITVTAAYDDSVYYYRTGFSRSDLEWKVESGKWKTSINSNTLEFEMDERAPVSVNPLPYYGLNKGVLRSFTRNGQKRLVLAKAEKVGSGQWSVGSSRGQVLSTTHYPLPTKRVSPRELDRIMKQRLVVTTRIFDHEQLHWGAQNAHVDGDQRQMPMDTVLHFAGGTLILKRVHLPILPDHYQHFVELHQRSNGDAYDRTGSIFIIPYGGRSTFFDGINNHPDSLPLFTGRDGERYQGIMCTDGYAPALEWVRFFTPFGVGRFNDRMQGYGIDWRPETYYKQEITDVYIGGDMLVGAWIGNYDGGGHLLTMDVKSYPGDQREWFNEESQEIQVLFNTCNVLEMAGQNYGKLFATDSLTVTFRIDTRGLNNNPVSRARLRYISTGHGGWGEGDEFVPKQNTLLIDGKVAFTHTPWREDCGCYRDLNPVSGNFWNGLSSSDLSRSGWCPGTATQPVYFDLTPWADGREHTLTVAIPQGKPVEGMFSHWAVSGTLIIEY
ncbi:MAG: glpgli family protein [Bacteroidales bacterium]|nr:glpgli family protein [Bacteroidales bacterium]